MPHSADGAENRLGERAKLAQFVGSNRNKLFRNPGLVMGSVERGQSRFDLDESGKHVGAPRTVALETSEQRKPTTKVGA